MKASDKQFRDLSDAAKAACGNAYCPYSHFPVGAAVLTDNDAIFAACNVENSSFGLSVCAERNAIFQAVALQGATNIRAILLYTPTRVPKSPCGACRQVISELGPDAEIIMVCDGPEVVCTNIRELLPDAFVYDALKPA